MRWFVSDPLKTSCIFASLFDAEIVGPTPDHRVPPETFVRLPGITIVLVQGTAPGIRTDSHIAFSITSQSIPMLKEKLAHLGIEAVAPRHGPPDRALYFADYDNYVYELNAEPLL